MSIVLIRSSSFELSKCMFSFAQYSVASDCRYTCAAVMF